MEKIHLLKENDTILLELHSNRKIECNFKSATKSGIIITNSLDLITKKQRKNQQHFYRSEIKSIVPAGNSNSSSRAVKIPKPAPPLDKKVFNQTTTDHIETLASTVICILQCDSQYFAAIEDLKYQEHIGMRADHICGRLNTKQPLISMCTTNSVYLFDILRMGKFPKELKTILESEQPRKIIFDSSLIADYLLHIEHCKLNGVLDVLVFHLMVKQKIEPIGFEECVKEYFEAEKYLATDLEIFYENRPLSNEAIQLAAHKVILVLKLFWHLMYDILLLPVMIESENFTTSFSVLPHQVDVMGHVNSGENPGIENIDINGLDHFNNACSVFNNNN